MRALGWRRWFAAATVLVVAAMVAAALFHNEYRSQNWDPMQARVYVDRTIRFGGTFYENGLVNKGPFELMVYRVAAAITSWDGFWYAISAFVLIVSGVLAWAACATTRALGGHRLLGVAVGIGVMFHFALGKADYAGVLYSRNMIIGLFAAAWLIALSPRAWLADRATWSAAAVGVLLGLAVQTLFVSTIAAFAVGLLAWSSLETLDDDRLYRRARRTLALVPITVFLSAPAYYLVRGRLEQFVSEYWTYNSYQNSGTGRSFANQLVYGRDVILRYYRSWPVSFVIIVAFFGLTAALWKTFDRRVRAIHLSLVVWFVGAWTELVLSQRYSSHYFSILALPTALMAAAVIGHVYRFAHRERGDFRSVAAWPLVASLLAIAAGGGGHLTLGLEAASSFTSVHDVAAQREFDEPGKQRTVRAVLDLVSNQDDPLLAWTEFPWTYLNYHRVAATRWIWKSFMLGQIYLGRSGPQYVLPKTWQWFADDMREAHPAAFLEEVALPLTAGTPFAKYVNDNFEQTYRGSDNNIYLRNDEAAAVLRGSGGSALSPVPLLATSKWQVGAGSASLPADTAPSFDDALRLSMSLCTRISGTYAAEPSGTGSFLSFRFDSDAGSAENMRLNIAGTQVFSGNDGAVFDSVNLDQQSVDPPTGEAGTADPAAGEPIGVGPPTVDSGATALPVTDLGQHEFAIVVGKRSAAIVIDGMIRAAVRLTNQTRVVLEARNGGVSLTNLATGPPPPDSGCATR